MLKLMLLDIAEVFWFGAEEAALEVNCALPSCQQSYEVTQRSYKVTEAGVFAVSHVGCFSSVQSSPVAQSLSRVQLFATPWIVAHQASLSVTNSRSSPRLMCIESVMPSSHLILYHPLLLLSPIPPSIRVFSNESPLRIGCLALPISQFL